MSICVGLIVLHRNSEGEEMEQKKKRTKFLSRSIAVALFSFAFAIMPIYTVYAALQSWNGLGNATDFLKNRIYSIKDIATYSSLQTTDSGPMTGGYSGRFFDNMRNNTDGSRLMYTKKLYVRGHVGDNIAIVAAKEDTADAGGSSLTGNNWFYYNVNEFDSSGYSLYDDGWKSMSESYSIGKTVSSNHLYAYGVNQTKREQDLGYIVLIFRWYNGDTSFGSGTQSINANTVSTYYPVLCIATQSFNYTFNLNGGNINGSTNDQTVSRFGITDVSVPREPTRDGYTFAGWKITSQGGKQKNKVYSTEQLSTMFTDTKYYSSLFEDAVFEAQWTAGNTSYKVIHKYPSLGDGYETKVEIFQETTDGYVTPAVVEMTGFTSPPTKTVQIKGDGSTIIEYIYTRNQYTVCFDCMGGVDGPTDVTLYYGQGYMIPVSPTRTGYYFKCWNTMADGKGTGVADQGEIRNLSTQDHVTVTLYAIWTQRSVSLRKIANSWHGGTFVKRMAGDEEWYNTVGKRKINETIPNECIIQEWVLEKDGTVKRVI